MGTLDLRKSCWINGLCQGQREIRCRESVEGPRVRIHFPPAGSHLRTGKSADRHGYIRAGRALARPVAAPNGCARRSRRCVVGSPWPAEFERYADLRERYFGPPSPESATVPVPQLANPDLLVQVEAGACQTTGRRCDVVDSQDQAGRQHSAASACLFNDGSEPQLKTQSNLCKTTKKRYRRSLRSTRRTSPACKLKMPSEVPNPTRRPFQRPPYALTVISGGFDKAAI